MCEPSQERGRCMQFFLYSEVDVLCILILVFLCIRLRSSGFLHSQQSYLLSYIGVNLAFFALDWAWTLTTNGLITLSFTLNCTLAILYHIFSLYTAVAWFLYSERSHDPDLTQDSKKLALAMIPAVVLLVLILTTPLTGWIFYISFDNTYQRGPLYILRVAVYFGYILYTATKALMHSEHTAFYQKRVEYRTFALCTLPCVLAAIAQLLFPFLPILCAGTTLSILFVYVTLQEKLISRDALTRLNNRNQLHHYLSVKLECPPTDKDLFLLLMDVDNFKHINDTYGHVEGDHALQLVADSLRASCSRKGFFIARYGGDEFVVLCELEAGESIAAICSGIHNALQACQTPYPLRLSIGWAQYTPAITTEQDFLARADVRLYEVKQEHKREGAAKKD